MKTAFLITLVAILYSQIAPPALTGSIEGYVVVAGSSRPIGGASVSLSGPPSNRPDPVITGTTDANGHFRFQNVPKRGSSYYRVGASAVGFDSTFHEVPFEAGQSLRNVVVTLMTGGNIRGRITDPSGAPLAGVTVFVYRENHIWTYPPRYLTPYYVLADGSGNLRSVDRVGTDASGSRAILASSQTDADGSYFLRRIPPAQYLVGVEFPVGYTSPNPNGFATTYYPGVTDSTKARPLIVEPETNLTGINFTVQKPARFTVSGRIENPTVSGTSDVTLHPPGTDRRMAPSWYARTSPDGRFNIPNVIAGSYELSVNGGSVPENLSVVVRGNVTGLILRLVRTTNVVGTFTVKLRPGDTQLPGSARIALDSSEGPQPGAELKVPGAFTIPSVAPGSRYLYRMGAPTGYVLDVLQGNHDVADDNLVRVKDNAEPIAVVIRPADYGSILGTIPSRDAKTRLSVVMLVPDGPRRANPMQYYESRTKYDGTFNLDTVVPGRYKLFAWEYGRVPGLDPYMIPSVPVALEKYGVSVIVPPNGRVEIEGSVIPR